MPVRHRFVRERARHQVGLHLAVGAHIVGASVVGAFSGAFVVGALRLRPHVAVNGDGNPLWVSRTVQDSNMNGSHDFHHDLY